MIHIGNIDADVRNADWTKRTWDLHDREQFQRDVDRMTVDQLRAFMRLPSWEAAPPWAKTIARRRLAEGRP